MLDKETKQLLESGAIARIWRPWLERKPISMISRSREKKLKIKTLMWSWWSLQTLQIF